jgi:hypothetical protein
LVLVVVTAVLKKFDLRLSIFVHGSWLLRRMRYNPDIEEVIVAPLCLIVIPAARIRREGQRF